MTTSINVGQIADNSAANENASLFAQIQENFGKFIVTPANAFGLGGFVFDIEGETSNTLVSDITDHFLEDNTAVQDHIAIRPQRVTLRSYVGEKVFYTQESTPTNLQKAVQKLTTLDAFLPALSQSAQQIQSTLSLASLPFTSNSISNAVSDLTKSTTLNSIVNLWALTKNLNPAASKQQQAYLYLKALQQQKILVSLQTPFEFVTNMAIESLAATQTEDTRTMSDFSITLKKIQTVSTATVQFDPKQYQNRAQQQAQPTAQQGNNQGGEVDLESTLHQLTGNLKSVF